MHSIAPHRLLRQPGLFASLPVASAPIPLTTTQIALPCTLVLAPDGGRLSSEGAVAVALLIDGENCSPDLVATALVEAARYGNVAIRRLYANPTVISQQRWQAMLTSHQIEAIHHERTAIGKNATDIALVVEAMDLLHQGAIGCFCLLASDSDYTPWSNACVQRVASWSGSGGYRLLRRSRKRVACSLRLIVAMPRCLRQRSHRRSQPYNWLPQRKLPRVAQRGSGVYG